MKKRGFTLIELLVVIAVIGLLASIVLVSVNSTREKARNAKRLSDIKQYVLAIEMAYDDNGIYPGITEWRCLGDYDDDWCWLGGTGHPESLVTDIAVLNDILSPYISSLPADQTLICGYAGDPARCYEGYIYQCTGLSGGICSGMAIRWFLEGDAECGLGRDMGGTCANYGYDS
jgi:prepilin-type N-terminal cleavage/methylation domain-containing protein